MRTHSARNAPAMRPDDARNAPADYVGMPLHNTHVTSRDDTAQHHHVTTQHDTINRRQSLSSRLDGLTPDSGPFASEDGVTDELRDTVGSQSSVHVIGCRDYMEHRSAHRQSDGSWTCDVCSPVVASEA